MPTTKRTLVISDIHTDVNGAYPVVEELAAYAVKEQAECLLIAGDICENVYAVMDTVRKLKKDTGAEVYYVPGNHDMWRSGQIRLNTDEIYELFCQDENCLCGKQVRVGEHIIVGDIGWYDYSFGDKEFRKEEFDRLEQDARVWQDKYYNGWTKDNIGKNKWFLARIEDRLQAAAKELAGADAENAAAGSADAGNEEAGNAGGSAKKDERRIVAMTHMIPHRAYTVPTNDRPMWKYFNAFLGSEELGKLYRRYPVGYALCGHVHYRHDFAEGKIQYMCRCLNYASEWWGEKDVRTQIKQAAALIEL